MSSSPAARHPLAEEASDAARRVERAEWAREAAIREWADARESYPLDEAIALEAAERDLRLARENLDAIQRALHEAQGLPPSEKPREKAWGGH